MNLDEVQQHWQTQVDMHGASSDASWSDFRVIEMETREIVSRLEPGSTILDVGCANGFSTVQYAGVPNTRVTGVDYIPTFIDQARERVATLPGDVGERLSFAVGDAMDLTFEDARFDAVVVVRVIINLGEWERQRQGLLECARVVKPGGRLLLSEATVQGWQRLNALRVEWGLPEIPMPSFNNYLDQDAVEEALAPVCELEEICNFASTYYAGTRVLKPLLAAATGVDVPPADPTSELNRLMSLLPAGGDYGTQKLFVFCRR